MTAMNEKFFKGLTGTIDRWVDREFGIPFPSQLFRKSLSVYSARFG